MATNSLFESDIRSAFAGDPGAAARLNSIRLRRLWRPGPPYALRHPLDLVRYTLVVWIWRVSYRVYGKR